MSELFKKTNGIQYKASIYLIFLRKKFKRKKKTKLRGRGLWERGTIYIIMKQIVFLFPNYKQINKRSVFKGYHINLYRFNTSKLTLNLERI